MRHRGLRRNEGTPCGDPKNGRQIVSRAGADADRPVLLSIPISTHVGDDESGAITQNTQFRPHYAIHYASLLIITHHPLRIITHHYTTKNDCVIC